MTHHRVAAASLLLASALSAADWSGDIPNGTVWPSGQVQRAVGDMRVPPGSTLTIQAGAIVKLGYAHDLVVDGTVTAVGTAGQPIIFTSIADDSAGGDTNGDGPSSGSKGDWNTIHFTSSSTASVLTHVEVRFGGDTSWGSVGAVYVNGGPLAMSACTIRDSESNGLRVANASPSVSGTLFKDNLGAAISINLGSNPAISTASFTNNATNGVLLDGGALVSNGFWNDPPVVYRMSGDVTVPAGLTLTLAPGQVVKAGYSMDLIVDGALDAPGTASLPIVLTSFQDDTAGGDTNNDGAHTPVKGDWNTLTFGATSGTSTLSHVDVRNGGDTSWGCPGAVVIHGGAVSLTSSIVQSSESKGIRIGSASPTLASVEFTGNQDAAIGASLAAQPAITSPTMNGNGTNGLVLDSGTLTSDVAWNDPSIVYVTSGDVTVPAGRTLSIAAGQVVKLANSHDLVVGGTLLANGTAPSPIVFTSTRDNAAGGDTNGDGATLPVKGDWNTITIQPTSTGSVIDHAEVRFGGDTSWGCPAAVVVDTGQLTLTNSLVRDSEHRGIRIVSASPTITNVTLQDNASAALGADLGASPTLLGMTLTNNGVNGLVLDGGALPGSRAWDDPDVVVQLSGDVTVPTGTTLTIAPGMIVKAGDSHDLIVEGTLQAIGTPAAPIVLTSYRDDAVGGDTNNDGATLPVKGDWNTITIQPSSTGSVVDHAEVRFGGDTSWGCPAAVVVNAGQLTFTNSLVRDSETRGIRIVSATPTITDVTLRDNVNAAMSADLGASPTLAAITVTANGVNGLVLDGGALPGSRAWDDPDVVVQLSGDVTVPTGTTLTIAPGMIVKAGNSHDLIVEGTLQAIGTVDAPIVFTSYRDDAVGGDTNNDGATLPVKGDWNTVTLGTASTGCHLDHVQLRYGGDTAWGCPAALVVNGGAPSLTNCTVTASESAGIRIVSANPTIDALTATGNRLAAISADVAASPAVTNVTISGNGTNGMALDGGTLAANASWNDPGIVYMLTSDVVVPAEKTLTVAPGQIVKAGSGCDIVVNGSLAAHGTLAAPVIFTSHRDDSAGGDTNGDGPSVGEKGDWNRVFLGATSTANVLDYVQLRYGGDTAWGSRGALVADHAPATLTRTIVRDSESSGIFTYNAASVTLESCILAHSLGAGVEAETASALALTGCTVEGNGRGVWVNAAGAALRNTIIAFHSLAGVRSSNGGTVTALYNDVYNPAAANGNFHDLPDPTGSNGNLSLDPKLADREVYAYSLLEGSGAIDAATSDAAPATDFFGAARFDDPGIANIGGGAQPYWDMGAIERQAVSRPINFVISDVQADPAAPEIGDPIVVSWKVTNVELLGTSADWNDAVFLSTDPVWDPADTRIAEVNREGGLIAQGSYTAQATLEAPAALPGPAHLIVRTDYNQKVRESVESDNSAAGVIHLDVPEIAVGTGGVLELTAARPRRYRRVTVPGSPLGKALTLNLDDADNLGTNRVFVRRDAIPSPQAFDLASALPAADHEIPADMEGVADVATYYILVEATSLGTDPSTLILSAALDDFSIKSFTPNTGGNGGRVTLKVDGVAFESGAIVRLVGPATRTASPVIVESSRTLYATCDLTGLPAGSYHVQVEQSFSGTDEEWEPVEQTLTATSVSSFTVTPGGSADVKLAFTLPSAVRAGRFFDLTLKATNEGNLDAPNPLLVLTASSGTELRPPGDALFTTSPVHVFALADQGPAGILRPGQTGTVTLQAKAAPVAGTIEIRAAKAVSGAGGPNYAGYITGLGLDPASGFGARMLSALQTEMGATWEGYQHGLRELATLLGTYSERVPSVPALLFRAVIEPETAVGARAPGSSGQEWSPRFRPAAPNVTQPPPINSPLRTGPHSIDPPPGEDGTFKGVSIRPYCEPTYLNEARQRLLTLASHWAGAAKDNLTRFASGDRSEVVYAHDSEFTTRMAQPVADNGSKAMHALHAREGLPAARTRIEELARNGTLQTNVPMDGGPIKTPPSFGGDGKFGLAETNLAIGGIRGGGFYDIVVTDVTTRGDVTSYSGYIQYTIADHFDFQAKNFDRNIPSALAYDLGWCTQPPLGFDAVYEVRMPFEGTVKGAPAPTDNIEPPKEGCQRPERLAEPTACVVTTGTTSGRTSWDPNDKVGPKGAGPQNRIAGDETLLYTILFENKPPATAPALRVTVTDALEPDLDRSTFALGELAFGSRRVSAPPGLTAWSTTVAALNPDGSPLDVNLSARLDPETGVVTWMFDSIDPAVGAPPDDPDAGFLPVNDATHRGEGYVTFTIKPKPGLPDNTQLTNQASIVFDENPPILTPTATNVIGLPTTGSGDANGDGQTNVQDVFYLINYLFAGGPPSVSSGDVNADGQLNVSDVFYLINYLFAGGPEPV